MNKPLAGVLFGAALGIVDGATAWFTPEVRPEIMGILIGSAIKGMVVGLISGIVARKAQSAGIVVAVGGILGLLFAFLVANMQHKYYFEIMLPGFAVGLIIGYLTQKA